MTTSLGSAPAPRRYRVSLYWDARGQTPVSYAAALVDCLEQWSPRAEPAARWFLRDRTGNTPLSDAPVEQLAQELLRNPRRWDFNGVEYTAHTALLTNGRRRVESFEIELGCGIQVPSKGIWFANQLHVDCFAPSELLPDRATFEATVALLTENFAPSWGAVLSPRVPQRTLEETYRGVPHVGWFTILSPEYPMPSVAPPGARIASFANGWNALIAVDEWFDDRDAKHLAQLELARRSLEQAGALRPRVVPAP